MALIRYPGSKEKLADNFFARMPPEMVGGLFVREAEWEYREPFFGAGAVGFRVLRRISPCCRVWINDIDPGMVALWDAVRLSPNELLSGVENFTPTPDAFYRFKEEDGRSDLPALEIALRKLALHRMSFSGLGAKAGGPIGGKLQASKYDVGCRWNPCAIRKDIQLLSKIMRRPFREFRITNLDFGDLIQGAPRECFIYADPPYYEKGPSLYKHAMNDTDHIRLAELLRRTEAAWVLSYDDHPFVRDLYSWATIERVKLTYTMASTNKNRPKNQEVIITR